MKFEIRSHGADVYHLGENGEEVELIPNHKYTFKCRILEIKIETNRVWHIISDFIITEDKTVVFQPEPVE